MENSRRIVFMGTPEFAVASLEALLSDGANVVGVVTVPDKPAGRGKKLRASAVKLFAVEHKLPVLQPENLKDAVFLEQLNALDADLFIVVAFRMLPTVVWSMPKFGTFNLHASLLPQYRGAAPINRAIMNGEPFSGVTTFLLDKKIDTGSILLQEKIAIDKNSNAGTVHDEMMKVGAKLVIKTTEGLFAGTIITTPQEQINTAEPLKPAPKIFRADCEINWHQPAIAIHNQIRGLSPYPCAFTTLQNGDTSKKTKLFASLITDESSEKVECGTVVSDGKHYLKVATADAYISILELQIEGKRAMTIQACLTGLKLNESTVFHTKEG